MHRQPPDCSSGTSCANPKLTSGWPRPDNSEHEPPSSSPSCRSDRCLSVMCVLVRSEHCVTSIYDQRELNGSKQQTSVVLARFNQERHRVRCDCAQRGVYTACVSQGCKTTWTLTTEDQKICENMFHRLEFRIHMVNMFHAVGSHQCMVNSCRYSAFVSTSTLAIRTPLKVSQSQWLRVSR